MRKDDEGHNSIEPLEEEFLDLRWKSFFWKTPKRNAPTSSDIIQVMDKSSRKILIKVFMKDDYKKKTLIYYVFEPMLRSVGEKVQKDRQKYGSYQIQKALSWFIKDANKNYNGVVEVWDSFLILQFFCNFGSMLFCSSFFYILL